MDLLGIIFAYYTVKYDRLLGRYITFKFKSNFKDEINKIKKKIIWWIFFFSFVSYLLIFISFKFLLPISIQLSLAFLIIVNFIFLGSIPITALIIGTFTDERIVNIYLKKGTFSINPIKNAKGTKLNQRRNRNYTTRRGKGKKSDH